MLVHAPIPHGGGRPGKTGDWFLDKKSCIVRIPDVPHNLCAAAAIVACQRKMDKIKRPFEGKRELTRGASTLHTMAGVRIGEECGQRNGVNSKKYCLEIRS